MQPNLPSRARAPLIESSESIRTIQHVSGDIIDTKAEVIVQQCNCLTIHSRGLAALIASRLSVDPYSTRRPLTGQHIADLATSSIPGTLSFHKVPRRDNFYVACLYAQVAPGNCDKRNPFYQQVLDERKIVDDVATREVWFKQCLYKLAEEATTLNLSKFAFPHGIGCGLAGGSWTRYESMIEEWAKDNPNWQVEVWKLTPVK
jgi:O-acetyl-ADP-ribose deacetylase (regulator of RNase III)